MDIVDEIKQRAGLNTQPLVEAITRKHFIAIADAIKTITDPATKTNLAKLIGDVMAAQNPRFDWSRWNGHIGV